MVAAQVRGRPRSLRDVVHSRAPPRFPMHLPRFVQPLLAVLFALLLSIGSAYATIPRTKGSWLFGPSPVWSDGTTSPSFRPLSDPIQAKGLLNVRVSTEMSEDSGNCKIRPALRYSNDGINWDASKDIVAGYRTTEGIDWGTTYIDISAGTTPRAWVQFGVEVANESGSAINVCNATLRVEPKEPVQ